MNSSFLNPTPLVNKVQNGGTCWDKEPFMKLMSRLCLPIRNRCVKAKATTAQIYESYQTLWGIGLGEKSKIKIKTYTLGF